MGTTARAPKQWSLSKNETINSFENWRQNLVYTLSLDTNFAPFLADGATWAKKTKAQPLRGFTDDGETVPLSRRKTARQKVKRYGTELRSRTLAPIKPEISQYGGEYWTKMLLDRTIRCIISNLPVYCLTIPGMLLCRTRWCCIVTGTLYYRTR